MADDYTIEDLHADIWALYEAGLLDVRMREDGEWVFSASEKSLAMTQEEIEQAVAKTEVDDR